jgi:ureidoglycolate dehydrogenase (NAD+)
MAHGGRLGRNRGTHEDRMEVTELEAFLSALFQRHGSTPAQADETARHMAWCELVGRPNFGVERVQVHLDRLTKGGVNKTPVLTVKRLGPGQAALDGDGAMGFYPAAEAMRLAIAMAREAGLGVVCVRNSNFFGAGSYYVNLAAEAGMASFAASNSFPKVAAHGGTLPVLGTNPLAFGAPRRDGCHFLLDMATSAMAGSTLRQMQNAGDAPLTAAGALLPFGGAKGFGLAMMVEILAGVLSGSGAVASMYRDLEKPGNNGHFMLAIDVGRWMAVSDFENRIEALALAVKASGPAVVLPGEARFLQRKQGLELSAKALSVLMRLAGEAGLQFPHSAGKSR